MSPVGSEDTCEPEERFGAHDDTLDESVDAQPSAEARPWLARQRFVHGLLRALHGADSSAREARVQAVMARVRPTRFEWRRPLLAAAAVLLASAAIWWAWPRPGSLPRAEALVARALASLDDPVDRAFTLAITIERGGREVHRDLDLVLRPGRRFFVAGEGPFGHFRVGCDGTNFWFDAGGLIRHEVPLAEASRFADKMGDVLDLGYLDLDELVRRLPQAALRSTRREAGAIRVEASGPVTTPRMDLDGVQILVDEATGMIRSLDATATRRGGAGGDEQRRVAKIAYRYVGERQLGADGYKRPW